VQNPKNVNAITLPFGKKFKVLVVEPISTPKSRPRPTS